ncbi:MAG: hypothetical protein IBJ00_02380 [Alphaproteobacteria bacterium]|nr:hypothetical protein [Alphaproteobacteria bacterium]
MNLYSSPLKGFSLSFYLSIYLCINFLLFSSLGFASPYLNDVNPALEASTHRQAGEVTVVIPYNQSSWPSDRYVSEPESRENEEVREQSIRSDREIANAPQPMQAASPSYPATYLGFYNPQIPLPQQVYPDSTGISEGEPSVPTPPTFTCYPYSQNQGPVSSSQPFAPFYTSTTSTSTFASEEQSTSGSSYKETDENGAFIQSSPKAHCIIKWSTEEEEQEKALKEVDFHQDLKSIISALPLYLKCFMLRGREQFLLPKPSALKLARHFSRELSVCNKFTLLTTLRLKHIGLKDSGARWLLLSLIPYQHLTTLDLSHNQLKSEDTLVQILALTKRNSNFIKLKLNHNQFKITSEDNVRSLSALVIGVPSLIIDLRSNPICPDSYVSLMKTKELLHSYKKKADAEDKLRLDFQQPQEPDNPKPRISKGNFSQYTTEEIETIIKSLRDLLKVEKSFPQSQSGSRQAVPRKLTVKEIKERITSVLKEVHPRDIPRGIIDERTLFRMLIEKEEYNTLKELLERLGRLKVPGAELSNLDELTPQILVKLDECSKEQVNLVEQLREKLGIKIEDSILLRIALDNKEGRLLHSLLRTSSHKSNSSGAKVKRKRISHTGATQRSKALIGAARAAVGQ